MEPSPLSVPKPGALTTEYERATSGGWWGALLMAAGVLVTATSTIVQVLTTIDGKAGQIAGAVLAIVGALYRGILDARYIASRTEVKVADALGASQVGVAQAQAAGPMQPASGQQVSITNTEVPP